jgi:predicted Ser/Thr protein kinase
MTTSAGDPDRTVRVDSGATYTPRPRADDAQFAPGTIIAGRYRVASILGAGGMGEVYRAEDTKLGQTVALKFLPARLARDPLLLGRLHEEVRLGRQVTHPNVCRIYDIGEADGAHFVAMEYIDGEDLGRLLKRIGRLAHDKAVDIARGIAAGLMAAHAKGILHRDLKPANVMIDSHGDPRIMDFGLALGTDQDDGTISGTPAYMAPEQLSGEPATTQSDLYSLGLVMYELFTGKRAHSARTMPERLRDITSGIRTPSDIVRDMDPAVERTILRCLSNEPADRPASVRDVIKALPGGDPLQAALAAGETPSPGLVAAAGTAGSLRRATAWTLLAIVLAALGVVVAGTYRFGASAYVSLSKSPAVLAERASTTLRTLGIPEQPFTEYRYVLQRQYLRRLVRDTSRPALERLRGAFPIIVFRTVEGAQPQPPDLNEVVQRPGTTVTLLDPEGRLFSLTALPPQPWPARTLDWQPLLASAGLDARTLTPAATSLVPPVATDTHVAWSGRAGDGVTPIHVEAGAWRGTPVFFRITEPSEEFNALPGGRNPFRIVTSMLLVVVILIGALLAWRNLRLRRGDRASALRVAGVIFVIELIAGLLGVHHQPSGMHELELLRRVLGEALLWSAIAFMLYLALEPFVRRRWPELLIASTRLVSGNYRDAMVGRDVLIGVAAGVLQCVVIFAAMWVAALQEKVSMPAIGSLRVLNGPRFGAADVAAAFSSGAIQGFAMIVVLVAFGIVLRHRLWAAAATAGVFLAAYATARDGLTVANVIITVMMVTIIARYGLLAAMMAQATYLCLYRYPLFTTAEWYSLSPLPLLVMAVLTLWAFHTSLGGQSVFGGMAFDE